MSDPQRSGGWDRYQDPQQYPNQPQWSQPTEQMSPTYPPVDPAYGGYYGYPGYPPPRGPETNDTQILPPYWTQTQYQPPPPPPPPDEPPPGPPKSPRWLWLVAGGAVAIVIGLVVALLVTYGSTRDDTAIGPLPPMPEPSTTVPPPTTTRTTTPTPTPTTEPTTTEPQTTEPSTSEPTTSRPTTTEEAATESVVYNVSGEGRAISITYVDTGGILQMEFNVALPWSREVSLSPSTVKAASVTVINVGRDISCSITLNGTQTEQRSGNGLTICSSIGG